MTMAVAPSQFSRNGGTHQPDSLIQGWRSRPRVATVATCTWPTALDGQLHRPGSQPSQTAEEWW
jgi:hypothetical protein